MAMRAASESLPGLRVMPLSMEGQTMEQVMLKGSNTTGSIQIEGKAIASNPKDAVMTQRPGNTMATRRAPKRSTTFPAISEMKMYSNPQRAENHSRVLGAAPSFR